MARSLTKIKEQIARLQREADSIQSDIVTRIKREIAQHGLTAEQLFGSPSKADAASAARSPAKPNRKSKSAEKPAKYADGQGNTWGGMGKRPQWVHAVLEAGHSLDEFLVGVTKQPASARALASPKKPTRKKATVKKAAPQAAARKAPGAKTSAAKRRKSSTPVKKRAAKKTSPQKSSSVASERNEPAA